MRMLFLFFPVLLSSAVPPIFELATLPAQLKAHNPLRPGTPIQITGTVTEFIEHQGSTVITMFDPESATAAGCTIENKSRRDLPEMFANRRYSVEGTLVRWDPQQAGTAILLDHCRVLPALIELKPQTLYLGVVRTGDREVGFQLRINEGGEGPFHARLTPIDSGKFLEEWEHKLGLRTAQRLTPGPSEWTGIYSRATKSMHLTRDTQHLDLTLQSPASFAGLLTVRKGTETQVRMMVANASGHLFGYQAQPNPQERRPPVPAAQPSAPRRSQVPEITLATAETVATHWFDKREEYRNHSASTPKKVEGGWILQYTVYLQEKQLPISLSVNRLRDGTINIQSVKTDR